MLTRRHKIFKEKRRPLLEALIGKIANDVEFARRLISVTNFLH